MAMPILRRRAYLRLPRYPKPIRDNSGQHINMNAGPKEVAAPSKPAWWQKLFGWFLVGGAALWAFTWLAPPFADFLAGSAVSRRNLVACVLLAFAAGAGACAGFNQARQERVADKQQGIERDIGWRIGTWVFTPALWALMFMVAMAFIVAGLTAIWDAIGVPVSPSAP
jgi:hypothetical protein